MRQSPQRQSASPAPTGADALRKKVEQGQCYSKQPTPLVTSAHSALFTNKIQAWDVFSCSVTSDSL